MSAFERLFSYEILQVISGLIAGGSFAEMSDFMPGVKVLLQVAQQQVDFCKDKEFYIYVFLCREFMWNIRNKSGKKRCFYVLYELGSVMNKRD